MESYTSMPNHTHTHTQVESSPHHYFAFALIGDFLFSHSPTELSSYLDQLPYYRRLLSEPHPFWVELVATYFTQAPHICVRYRWIAVTNISL